MSRPRLRLLGPALGALVLVVAIVAAVALAGRETPSDPGSGQGRVGTAPGPPDAVPPPAVAAGLLATVPERSVSTLDPVRLAPGLVPPTNRWFSGLVFGAEAQPVFAEPLSMALTDSGFSIGVPQPVTSAAAILGPHVAAVTVDLGASSAQVVAYDDASVTLAFLGADGRELARLVLAQGSPFVHLSASASLEVSTGARFDAGPDGTGALESQGRGWRLLAPAGALTVDGTHVRLAAGQTATWYPLPDDASPASEEGLLAAAAHPVMGTAASYGVGGGVVRTTIRYRTADGGETAYVTMPHHRAGKQPDRSCALGSYPSVYGSLDLCAGSQLTSWAPIVEPSGSLDLTGLADSDRATILAQVALDVASTPDDPADTYFGGKWLARAATLVTLGEQLGAGDVVAPLRAKASALLRQWTEPKGCVSRDARCFVYDPQARGLVGLTPSFGSQDFNDHHFHYGYFLAAAGMLSAGDPGLAADLAPVMNLMAADIAAGTASPSFPRLRVFDVYAGHSWASGTAPFADGNNQESLSEAVNAWNGLGLWAQVADRPDLAVEATWLLSTEAAASLYWTHLDLGDPVYRGFDHQVVALNWGGKRDWATWFSAEPSAMLGILLLPVTPVSDYLATTPGRIRASIAEAAPHGFDVLFGDSLLMYRALAGPQDAAAAWDAALVLPEARIDDGDSRAFLLAWIAAHR